MRLPYIGVTGVTTLGEAEALADLMTSPEEFYKRTGRRFMCGLLASLKTLRGEEVPNRRYPPISRLSILAERLSVTSFVTVHYNTQEKETFAEQLFRVLDHAPHVQGVQLNIRRPDPEQVHRLRAERPDLEIILQANGASLPSRTPEGVQEFALSYGADVDHVLLDLSGGTGAALDPDWALDTLSLVGREWAERGICPGIAGGLGPDSAEVLSALDVGARAQGLPLFSVDAEGRLRVPVADPLEGEAYQDQLSLEKVQGYLNAARSALFPQRSPAPRR